MSHAISWVDVEQITFEETAEEVEERQPPTTVD